MISLDTHISCAYVQAPSAFALIAIDCNKESHLP